MLNAEQIKKDWEKRGLSFGIWEDSPGQVWKGFVHKNFVYIISGAKDQNTYPAMFKAYYEKLK